MRLLDGCCGNQLTHDITRLDALDGCLGEHHNVALVETILVSEALLQRRVSARCLRLLRQYQHHLRRRAAALGARALRDTPHHVIQRVESYWRASRQRRAKEAHHPWRRAA
jgi:hypothetical protein